MRRRPKDGPPPLQILGFGGHGRDVLTVAQAVGELCSLFDDRLEGYPPTGRARWDWPTVVGVNDPATRRRLSVDHAKPATLVHPSATVAGMGSQISPGVVVAAGTEIGPNVHLGEHVHVGAGCTITRCKVGAFTTIAPGVDIAGDVTIGEECLIGVGAVISNLVTIGDRCTIGAGAVVIHDVPDDTTVAGVPAKPLSTRETA